MTAINKGIRPYIVNEADDGLTAEVNLYGEVVQHQPVDFWTGEKVGGLFITLDDFLADLERLSMFHNVTFHINSVGGDLFAGVSIYNRIKDMKAHTVTIVDGLAASAASIIALAGDERYICHGGQVMAHSSSTFLFGSYNRKELADMEKALTSIDRSIADIYADATGHEKSEMMTMIGKEAWMDADEAIERGFMQGYHGEDDIKIEVVDESLIKVNGICHYAAYAPGIAAKITGAAAPLIIDETKNDMDEGGQFMNLETLKQEHPELVAALMEEFKAEHENEIENAVKAERERLQGIDSIADAVADKELVSKARYTEPMTAAELSLKAMQEQAKAGKEVMTAMLNDSIDSGVENVEPEPVSGSQSETRQQDYQDSKAILVDAFKNLKEVI